MTTRQRQHPPAPERRRFAAPRELYRYVPVPPVGLDSEGYLCDDEMSQTDMHASAMIHACTALRAHFGAQAAVHVDIAMPYAEGDRSAIICPDVMVSLGSERSPANWKLWERAVPEFVLELLSPSNWRQDVGPKKDTYGFLGVQECWLFDGGRNWLDAPLEGYRLRRGAYERVKPDAKGRLLSRTLGLELRAVDQLVRFFHPRTGVCLQTHEDSLAERQAAMQEAVRLKQETERLKQEAERQKQEAERLEREALRQKQEAERRQRLVEEKDTRIAELEAQLGASRKAP